MKTTKTTSHDGEYRVRLFVDGEYQSGADYFTTDKQDAKDTALAMTKSGGISDKTTDFAKDEQADYESELIIYDVCNDYSLDTCTTDFESADYKKVKHSLGTIYIHKEYDEIHYLKAVKGLEGKFLFQFKINNQLGGYYDYDQ